MDTAKNSNSRPRLSAVICTRDRPDCIGTAVKSVLANGYPSFDLLVVDQSTDEATERELHVYRADPRLTYLHSSTLGAATARNLSIARATGDILAFTDDDCVVPPTWIEQIAHEFASLQNIDAVYGAVHAPPGFDSTQAMLPVYTPACRSVLSRPCAMPLPVPMSANMACRRNVLRLLSGFDVALGPGTAMKSAEDIDLLYRFLLNGKRVLIAPHIAVVHYGWRDYRSGSAAKHVASAMFALGAYYGKHVACLDRVMIHGFLRDVAIQSFTATHNLITWRRPFGIKRPLFLILGFLHALRCPIDRQRRLYGTSCSASAVTS